MNMNEKTKTIIREIGSHEFPGFYESVFCSSDDFIDYEYELKKALQTIDENVDVYYEYDDIHEYEKDVCRSFMQKYVESIKNELPYDVVDDEDFLFNIKNEEEIIIVSPKYYNYSTDKCYCNIETNIKTLEQIKNYALDMEGATDHIIRKFTSCDGFISFINNDINYWWELPIEEYEENMLIALLDMLLILSNDDYIFEISIDVIGEIEKCFYAYPVIDYNKKLYPYNTSMNIDEISDEKVIKMIEMINNY